jgi:hypothetical protein
MKHAKVFAILSAGVLLAGCELIGLMAGHGTQAALFKFPPAAKVVVLVDVRPGVVAPAAFSTTLADKVAAQIYRMKGANNFVSQDRLLELQQRDPAAFKTMGAASVARAMDADLVLEIDLVKMETPQTYDKTAGSGQAQVIVKVINRNGDRIWPVGDSAGQLVQADVELALTQDRDKEIIERILGELLSIRTARMFHDYSLDDRTMTR